MQQKNRLDLCLAETIYSYIWQTNFIIETEFVWPQNDIHVEPNTGLIGDKEGENEQVLIFYWMTKHLKTKIYLRCGYYKYTCSKYMNINTGNIIRTVQFLKIIQA